MAHVGPLLRGRRSGIALVLALAGFALASGCGEETPDVPVDPKAKVRSFGAEARSWAERIRAVTSHPWKRLLPFSQELVRLQTELLLFADSVQMVTADPRELTSLEERGRRLLDERIAPLHAGIEGLERLVPSLNAIWNMEVQIANLIRSLEVTDDAPFPLRQQFRLGWHKSFEDAFRFLDSGLEELRDRRDATRFKIGVAKVTEAQDEGANLLRDLSLLSRDVKATDGKIERLETYLGWTETVLEHARGHATERPASPSAVEAIAAARTAAQAALPELRARWEAARPRVLAGEAEASEELARIQADADAERRRLLDAALPVARELGLPEPK